jgi:hypothetical protein
MKIEAGQFWKMKKSSTSGSEQTYYVYKVFPEGLPTFPYGRASMERIGTPDPDYLHDWSEPLVILEEHYNLITDKDEIGFLHLQRDD